MNRKKLPKAVARTAAEMLQPETTETIPSNVVEIGVRPVPAADSSAMMLSQPADSAADADPRAITPPVNAGDGAARRRKAKALVERYANLSTAGGALPVPLANAAAVTALLMRMVKKLSELYDVPFERNRTRSLIIGLMGGALPTGLSTITTATLTVFVPGLNVMGLAVSAITSGAFARSIGQLYIEHFENGRAIDLANIIKR